MHFVCTCNRQVSSCLAHQMLKLHIFTICLMIIYTHTNIASAQEWIICFALKLRSALLYKTYNSIVRYYPNWLRRPFSWGPLHAHGLLLKNHSAYRRIHSCKSALLCLVNDILAGMGKQEVTALIAIDLSAEFDLVDHDTLLSVLENHYRIRDIALV